MTGLSRNDFAELATAELEVTIGLGEEREARPEAFADAGKSLERSTP